MSGIKGQNSGVSLNRQNRSQGKEQNVHKRISILEDDMNNKFRAIDSRIDNVEVAIKNWANIDKIVRDIDTKISLIMKKLGT
jgi:hypothetical protein